MGLALKRSINRIARRLRLGSPRLMLSNSVAAQLINFPSYEIHSLHHCLLGLVYNEMSLGAQTPTILRGRGRTGTSGEPKRKYPRVPIKVSACGQVLIGIPKCAVINRINRHAAVIAPARIKRL